MTSNRKTVLVLAGACAIAGLVAFGALSGMRGTAQTRPSEDSAQAPVTVDHTQAQASASQAAAPVGWVFRVSASAKDDPEVGRAVQADIDFVGTVEHCTEGSNRGGQSLGLDADGGVATATRSASICVPGCSGLVPPPARSASGSVLDVSAFQEEFDRASGEYAAVSTARVVDWQCGGAAGRVTAAALVALACNVDGCDDVQRANASVYLGAEQGARLAPAKAFFALQGTSGHPLVGAVALP